MASKWTCYAFTVFISVIYITLTRGVLILNKFEVLRLASPSNPESRKLRLQTALNAHFLICDSLSCCCIRSLFAVWTTCCSKPLFAKDSWSERSLLKGLWVLWTIWGLAVKSTKHYFKWSMQSCSNRLKYSKYEAQWVLFKQELVKSFFCF